MEKEREKKEEGGKEEEREKWREREINVEHGSICAREEEGILRFALLKTTSKKKEFFF